MQLSSHKLAPASASSFLEDIGQLCLSLCLGVVGWGEGSILNGAFRKFPGCVLWDRYSGEGVHLGFWGSCDTPGMPRCPTQTVRGHVKGAREVPFESNPHKTSGRQFGM